MAWISANRQQLDLSSMDAEASKRVIIYILGNMYAGTWFARNRLADHPRCSSSISNGDCWTYGFAQSVAVDNAYCNSAAGKKIPKGVIATNQKESPIILVMATQISLIMPRSARFRSSLAGLIQVGMF